MRYTSRAPRHVQPVAAPALPLARIPEQFFNEPGVGIRALIGEESLNFFRSRRLADQVEADATHQETPVSLRRRSDPFRL